jgi:hypothetical protein
MKILKIIIAIPLLFLAGWIALLALYVVVLLLAGFVGMAHEGLFGSEADRRVQTHVTIYVDPALQRDGGVVTVAAIAVDEQKWLQISSAAQEEKTSLAMLDPLNPKIQKVKVGDLHSGVVISSAASTVEIYHLKNGSYTYNFLPLPHAAVTASQPALAPVETKIVTAGSGSNLRDPETGGQLDWPSVNVVAVLGTKNSENWARAAHLQFSNIDEKDFNQTYSITKSPTTRVMQVTEFGFKKYFMGLAP